MSEQNIPDDIKRLEGLLNRLNDLAKRKGQWSYLESSQYYHIIGAAGNLALKEGLEQLNHVMQNYSVAVDKTSEEQAKHARGLTHATWYLVGATIVLGLATLGLVWITYKSFQDAAIAQNKAIKTQERLQDVAFENEKKIQEISYRNALALKGLHHQFNLSRAQLMSEAESDLDAQEKGAWTNISIVPNSGARKTPKVYDTN